MQDRRDPPPDSTGASPPRHSGGRFLIVRLSALGDVLHALPAAAALRRERPGSQIGWIIEDRFASILDGHPAVDRVHVVPRNRWRTDIRRPWRWPHVAIEFARFVGGLWRARYDASIDLQGNAKSGLWSLLSGAPARFGFRTNDAREGNALGTNRHVRPPDGAVHRVERALAVVAAVVSRPSVTYAEAPPPRSPADRAWVDRALVDAGLPPSGFAVVHPGTSGFGAFKRWPTARFGALARNLASAGWRVVVTIGPSEGRLGDEVVESSGRTAIALAPPNLTALAELVSRAGVFVSADTGPLHLAAAAGVPVVALFGPKDADVYAPYRPPTSNRPAGVGVVVTSSKATCRPCALRRCPDPVCMTSIDVADVAAGVERALATDRA